ncbi:MULTISPECIES: HigA family addiction module antitoxin [unclassified Lactobacillus]|uniref:HigA family addiction module antitoxin n=1 Tax=unclassified Lactobacillus TaxID=2620435 RepID=UPI0023F9F9C6|nr:MULTISPECIES: HigA family addiction module antitoxin [unclassified Lactobacillus]MDF7668507.1 HigA family addiction module antitoxin [Lactobacillus sp. ESL0703]WEV37752.1 HigA family addiction module antitoxin [Lactobacillus sp. ESL0677]
MSNETEYKDLIAFHPGSYIEEIVEDLNITQAEFADRLEVSAKTVSKLINGETAITSKIANKLAKLTGISMKTWLSLQTNYEVKLAEIENQRNADEKRACDLIDFSYFKKYGYADKSKKRYSKSEKIQILRRSLKTSNLSQLFEFNPLVSYRRADFSEKSIVCSNVMLELATMDARNKTNNKYEKVKLEKALPIIRKMTLQKTKVFYPRLKQLLLDCGIVLEAFPNLKNASLNGATKKFKNGSILLLITDRNKNSDIFWFSLIHELGHIYYEDFYSDYEDKEKYQEKEKKADRFAENFLIPQESYKEFVKKHNFDFDAIQSFAKKVKINLGIVIGRLQSDKYLKYNQYSNLKSKYKISLQQN